MGYSVSKSVPSTDQLINASAIKSASVSVLQTGLTKAEI